ncbi:MULTISPECIES: aspartate dehydrogenase [Bordetella]|uniref:L-aspartate dehydrogenase n=1 Tax=Bordetella genomosp. 6 TaxID=463024 RepID=A0ABX4FFP7_9BORD|nr:MULTISPECIES: aspartate dehydrogenase [Bordetella]ARP77486.1 aspartate dehydrogenase [Bordetella genomosp. 6]KCV61825.1 PF01958 domain protein [Bordetella bronchiseptica 99-R-0433]OZI75330.1 aspartate dehydrogenase [Bordetella genomosp. 6]
MTHRIAFIGLGAIASDVAAGLLADAAQPCQLAALTRAAADLPPALAGRVTLLDSLSDLLAWRPDLVVEAAGQQAIAEHAEGCLKAGLDMIICSAGALADDALRARLIAAAEAGGARIRVPAGAIAGLDYLQAVAGRDDAEVVYESRKPVAAWRAELPGMGIDPDTLAESRTLFSGPAREAALRFPKNLNVAATLALAGIGMTRTRVEVVVDPRARGNQHRIQVRSPLGEMQIELVNAPSPANPKTSWLVAQSVLATIRRHLARFTIG